MESRTLEAGKKLAALPTVELGSSAEGFQDVKRFLARFGYIGNAAGVESSTALDESTAMALLKYQSMHALSLTGNFDESTREMMSRPRCGVPDLDPATGLRFALKCRWKQNTLKYAFSSGTSDVPGDDELTAVRRALATWSAAVPIAFRESGDSPDIRFAWTSAKCGDADMTGTMIAHADYPPGCGALNNTLPRPVHFDNQETFWSVGGLVSNRWDVETVALHEIGHILGMDHSEAPTAVMFSTIPSSTRHITLTSDDLGGIRRHYSTVGPIFARHSGLCLDIQGASAVNGADATQWEYVGGRNQTFLVEYLNEDGHYMLVADHSGRVLDVEGMSLANGAQVHQWDWWRGDNQRFRLDPVGDGYYRIVAKSSGKCLDVSGVSQAFGAKVVQWDWVGGGNQQWRLGHAPIISRHAGRTMDVQGAAVNNGAPLLQYSYKNAPNQRFRLDPVGEGYFRILVEHSGKCVDVAGNSTASGARVQQWEYVGGNNQKFKPVSTGSGYYKLIAKHSGKCLDVSGGFTADGSAIIQWDYVGGNNQQWRL
ncbi:RICIN domain-containing protein [Streptomyces sp. NPDC098781]|uniref:RICIN domain-containing protein n=1 Tax=Streptomyces sp. NPDC098781 TaxID=3366097 RepID=UPI003806F1C3